MRFGFVLLFLLLPLTVCAQTQDEQTGATGVPKVERPEVKVSESGSVQAGAVGSQTENMPRYRRGRRVIVNREFDDREKIMLLLNAHCDFPSKSDLLSTSADAEKHLHSIVNDPEILFSVRRRALEALAYFETEYNLQMLEWILKNPDKIKHPLMLMQAIRSYPQVAPKAAPAILEPYLSSDNDMIRFVTISALKNCPGQEALDTLKDRYAVEKNRFFQTRLKQAIDGHCKQETYCSNRGR